MHRIYLDHNASTPLDPRVLEAMLPWLRGSFGNPSSLHAEGREARRAVEDARDAVAEFLSAEPREVIFTSSATEANNTALVGLLACQGGRLAVSAIEHPSVLHTASALQEAGAEVTILPVDRTGVIDEDALEEELRRGVGVLAVMAANNEVGSVQPWGRIARRCGEVGTCFHVDAVQAAGKTLFDVSELGLGTAALSAHKMGGPKGTGVLWVRAETRLRSLLHGGDQERQRRAGTENVAGIVGMGETCRLAQRERTGRIAALGRAESCFVSRLKELGVPFLQLGPGSPDARLPGTLSLRVPGTTGELLLLALDLRGVSIGLGSACKSGAAQPSHVLRAMGFHDVENLESFRVSLHWDQPAEQIHAAADVLAEVIGSNLRR